MSGDLTGLCLYILNISPLYYFKNKYSFKYLCTMLINLEMGLFWNNFKTNIDIHFLLPINIFFVFCLFAVQIS